jgi:preprotein translocase subunit SecF
MKKSNPIIIVLLLVIVGISFMIYGVTYSQEFRDDCNLILQDDSSLKEDYGFFLKEDIKKAFEQMR